MRAIEEGRGGGPGGDKCYCKVNVKGRQIKGIDRQAESSAVGGAGANIWQQLETKAGEEER